MEKQIQCPSCKTYKVENFGFNAIKFGVCCILSAIIVKHFFDINYIAVICFAALGILCVINGSKSLKKYTCKGCNYKFEAEKNA